MEERRRESEEQRGKSRVPRALGCRDRAGETGIREGFGRLAVHIASGCMHRGGVGRGRRGSRSALTYCSTFVRRAHSSLSEPRGVVEEEEEKEKGGDRGGR